MTHDTLFLIVFILISLLASLQAEHGGGFPGSMSTVLILVCSPLQLVFLKPSLSPCLWNVGLPPRQTMAFWTVMHWMDGTLAGHLLSFHRHCLSFFSTHSVLHLPEKALLPVIQRGQAIESGA